MACAGSRWRFGGFVLAPQSAVLIHRYRWWETDFITSLEQNLNALGGQRLSGHIQCIDTISGCGNVLYRMRLEPANGLLVDFSALRRGRCPLCAADARERFFAAMYATPPQVHRGHRARSMWMGREIIASWTAGPPSGLPRRRLHARDRVDADAAPRAGGAAKRRPPATASTSCAVLSAALSLPSRLKLYCNRLYGTGEPVPLRKGHAL